MSERTAELLKKALACLKGSSEEKQALKEYADALDDETARCPRCGKLLGWELAAKYRILDKMFWNPGEPIDDRWHECHECHARLSRRIRRFFSDLIDPVWWEYHSWYDFQRVILRRKPEEFTQPLWWRGEGK
jgi:hypothetical protein